MELTRRNLLGSTAVAGTVVAGAALTGTAFADEPATAAQDGAWDEVTDVLVVGEGMGGLCAAMSALEGGAPSVTIVEVSQWVGGGSALSVRSIHVGSAGMTAESLASFSQGLSFAPKAVAAIEQVPDLQLWGARRARPAREHRRGREDRRRGPVQLR